ncbi:MAG: hypothetical protein ACJA1A_000952 [Saprospiraceae bacterium]|jgi:hypothetical protein|tara:strand:- start:2877 stop:3974 length:1098 start_codon:yes stop_codon:yes gene_type:complete
MIVKSEKYWADLLEQYKLGSISKKDRFELEKRALDDPFLFDALEGFSIGEKVSSTEKKVNAKLFTLPRMAAAASLIFLVAMIFLLKSDGAQNVGNDQTIAMVMDSEETQSELEEEISIDDKELNSFDGNEENIDNVVEELTTTSTTIEKTNSPIKRSKQINKKQPADDKLDNVNKTKQDQVSVINENVTSNSNNTESTPNQSSEANSITEPDDVTSASVESDEEEVANQVEKFDTNNNIIIDLDSRESEDIAGTDGNSFIPSKSKMVKKEDPPSTFYIVEPAIGKKDFDEFVKESINNRGLRQESPHEVTVEFNIDKDGALSNFLHIYNGCSECGGYAIYLLSSSGLWKTVPIGQAGRARYTLEF